MSYTERGVLPVEHPQLAVGTLVSILVRAGSSPGNLAKLAIAHWLSRDVQSVLCDIKPRGDRRAHAGALAARHKAPSYRREAVISAMRDHA